MAYDGVAESTPPSPAINRIPQCGSPMAAVIWARIGGPIDAPIDWLMCWWNMRRKSGRNETMEPSRASSERLA